MAAPAKHPIWRPYLQDSPQKASPPQIIPPCYLPPGIPYLVPYHPAFLPPVLLQPKPHPRIKTISPPSSRYIGCGQCDTPSFNAMQAGCICPICGKIFSRHWLLQGHLRTHTGEKPFKCHVCNKAFADKSNMRAHVQTHSGLKPWCCDRCGKHFALKSYLSKHQESACATPRLRIGS